MKPKFDVHVHEFDVIEEIEGAWATADYLAILDHLEFGDTSDMGAADLLEMALLALQDLEPVAAAELLLSLHLGSRLNKGQIRNAANEMLEEKLWEEYADLSLHEAMFNVASVLFKAFPRVFPEPDAVKVSLEVSAINEEAQDLLNGELTEPFLVRLLAGGMDGSAILPRLFEDQLHSTLFPEADNIVWIWEVTTTDTSESKIRIISSAYWLDPLRNTKSYTTIAYLDG